MQELCDEIELDYAVDMAIEVQPTHTFDLNAQDAFFHGRLKQELRDQGLPKTNEEAKSHLKIAVSNISDRAIQKGFMRAYSRNKAGDEDPELIPEAFKLLV